MAIMLIILFIIEFVIYIKAKDGDATPHCNTYKIDSGKVNDDRRMNNSSEAQINKNITLGKYDTGKKW